MRFGKNPNQPETGVNLRQHVIRTDTDIYAMRTGERGDHIALSPARSQWSSGLGETVSCSRVQLTDAAGFNRALSEYAC